MENEILNIIGVFDKIKHFRFNPMDCDCEQAEQLAKMYGDLSEFCHFVYLQSEKKSKAYKKLSESL